jgi:hypothetical protein
VVGASGSMQVTDAALSSSNSVLQHVAQLRKTNLRLQEVREVREKLESAVSRHEEELEQQRETIAEALSGGRRRR